MDINSLQTPQLATFKWRTEWNGGGFAGANFGEVCQRFDALSQGELRGIGIGHIRHPQTFVPGQLHDHAGVNAALLQVANESAAKSMEPGGTAQTVLRLDACFDEIAMERFHVGRTLPENPRFGLGEYRPSGKKLWHQVFQDGEPVCPAALCCLGAQEQAGIVAIQADIGPNQTAGLFVAQAR